MDVLSSYPAYAAIFYSYALLILPRYLTSPPKYTRLIVSQLLLLILFILFHIAQHFYFMAWINPQDFGTSSMVAFTRYTIWWFFYYGSLGTGYWILTKYMANEKRKGELERSLLQAELSFLKYQFNPHFLYNTLSFIHAKAYPLSEELSKAILLLSDIMRYALEGKPNETVSLEKELKYLGNLIELHRMRFNHNFHVEYLIEGDITQKRIIPLLFISFVENAFKHGQVNNPNSPIVIKVKTSDSSLMFYIRNKKNIGMKEISTEIGLENTKRRLNLAYENKYHLNIKEDDSYYECQLTIME